MEYKKENVGNLLLISGNGRNVGKTFFACRLIEYLSPNYPVTAVKISPHFHQIQENADVMFHSEEFIVINETEKTHKDSSLFLQAGALKVLFVMVRPENTEKAFQYIKPLLASGPAICESAGLYEWVDPGLFFFVIKAGDSFVKNGRAAQNAVVIENDGITLNFDVNEIGFENNQFYLID